MTVPPRLRAIFLCGLLALPLAGQQKLLLSLGAGMSSMTFLGLFDEEYKALRGLSDLKGFPAPGLLMHVGLLLTPRFSIGVDLADLERGSLFSNNLQTVEMVRHTPLLGRITWYWKPYDSKWNVSLRAAGGVVAEHVVRRQYAYPFQAGALTYELYYPFMRTDAAVWPGIEVLYRTNPNAVIVLSWQQPVVFQSRIITYPILQLGIQLQLSLGEKE